MIISTIERNRQMNMKRVMMIAAMAAILGAGFVPSACAAVERPVPPSVVVESVKFRQRYPWNGLVDIDAKITCSDPATNLAVYVTAWDNVKDRALKVKTVWVDGDETKNPDLVTKSGTTRIVWDARADNPNEVSQNVSVSVQAYVRDMRYLVVDLMNGPDAAEYACAFMPDPPDGGWTDEYKTNKLVMRFIPAGTFIMGTPEYEMGHNTGWECVETQHKVTLTRPFYMGIFEVTQKQYELVVGTNPSEYKGDTRPVERVCYDTIRGSGIGANWPTDNLVDSNTFLGRIRVKTGRVFDLPTEAQWEYACRAGTTSTLNNGKALSDDYLKSDNMFDLGRYTANRNDGKGGYSQHTAVGAYPANLWGLYDMHGNVAEWCRDWLVADLGNIDMVDPMGAIKTDAKTFRYTITVSYKLSLSYSGNFRIMRGGGWCGDNMSCRSGFRGGATANDHNTDPRGNPYVEVTGYSGGTPNMGNLKYAPKNDWGFRVMCEAMIGE